MTNDIRDLTADAVLPGDTITHHPDHPDREGEWAITHIRRVGPAEASVRLDYRHGDGIGCFIVPAAKQVTCQRGARPWLEDLSAADMEDLLAYLCGWTPEGVHAALAHLQDRKDRRAFRVQRHEELIAS